jgi:MarR family transcriptional regulator, organic hydroperoxide resistance regulator
MARSDVAHDGQPVELGATLGFMQVMWELVHALDARSKRMASRIGVTGPQRLVLRIVGAKPRISAGALAKTLRLHPSSLTGVLRRLEKRGLILRKPDPADARRALLSLARAGAAVNTRRAGTVEAAVARALARLGERELATAQRVLSTLIEELERDDA